ncbi:autotransporter outer membrane beta-barrel domain-containing protein [Phascolarctobacterium sp.]|uniref:autotransporter outer membrane beta-barrel domain-containing protein n=1 Tax=Phascolarctobacterium sp. TaxID=2049039 RepID=UPI0026DB9989|nr:autotransporter outer membrane beta-barrel domain-containing protein [Phascolarctobacterium sp.]
MFNNGTRDNTNATLNAANAKIFINGNRGKLNNYGTAEIGTLESDGKLVGYGDPRVDNFGSLTVNHKLASDLSNHGTFIYNGTETITGLIMNYDKMYVTSGELKVIGDFHISGEEALVGANANENLNKLSVSGELTVGSKRDEKKTLLTVDEQIQASSIEAYGDIKTQKLTTDSFNVFYVNSLNYGENAASIEVDELVVSGKNATSNIGAKIDGTGAEIKYGPAKVIVHDKLVVNESNTLNNYGQLLFDGDSAVISGDGIIENKGEKLDTYLQKNNIYGVIAKNGAGEKIKELTIESTLNNTGIVAVETLNVANGYDDTFATSDKSSKETFMVDNLNVLADGNFNLKQEAYVLKNVGVGADAELTAAGAVSDVESVALADDATFETESLAMADSGAVTSDGGSLTAKAMSGESLTFNLQSDKEEQINVTEFTGNDLKINVASLTPNQVVIDKMNGSGITINGNSDITDSFASDNIEAGLQSLAYAASINEQSGDQGRKVASPAGKILGPTEAMTDANNKIITSSVKEGVNPANEGISEMASIALMTWRQENNDMNKRLGELRDSAGEHGVWVRMTRGEAKYGNQNIKNQYNAYQLGYDEKLSVDKRWTVGAALTYTDAESSFSYGKGENKHKGLAVYGSRLNDDGSFIDLIARYARLEHDYEVYGGAGKGDFDTNGYSLSAEYGKRFTQKSGLWIEPQVELTYGRVSSGEYLTNNGVRVRQEGMDSVVGRLGFALGKNLAQGKGNVYLRASYLYDFDGETDVRYSYGIQNKRFEQDLGGGWWEVGVGTNINLSEASHLYFDVEKTYGGDVATPWQWNAGVRWSF